jgi:hypothetical protein
MDAVSPLDGHCFACQPYLTESVSKVVLQKSIPVKMLQLILHISNSKGQVDGFVRE